MLYTKSNLFFVLILLKSVLTSDFCTTPECRKASSDILSFIDPAVDPCEDFYKFTCSGIFKKTHEAKPASLEEITRKELEDQTTMMLIKPIDNSEPKPIQGLKKLFRACMDEAAIEKYGYSSVKRALKLLGGWPVVEGPNWNEDNFSMEELLVKLRRMGYEFTQFFDISTTVDDNGPAFVISEPSIKHIEAKDKENYHDYMVDTAMLLGANKQIALHEMQETLMFKRKLINILEYKDDFNKTAIRNIQDDFQFINWVRYLNNIVYPNEEVSEDDEIYFPSTTYFRNLESLLKDTSKRTIANYLIWETLAYIEPYLPKRFRELKMRYLDSVSNTPAFEENKLRLSFCKNKAKEALNPTFEILYLKDYFTDEKKEKIHEIVSIIRDELIELLNETDVYDEDTRVKMLEKADALTYVIGAPEKIFDAHLLREIFDDRESINTNDFLTIASTLNRQSTNMKFKLDSVVDFSINDYEETVLEKAYYSTLHNNMVLPAGTLHGLYFNENRPRYLNFGTIGRLLASELFHGFTLEGSNYEDGPYHAELWTNATKMNFIKQSACLVEEIEDYEIENSDYRMNGEQVLDETVCDYTGVELAYRAYENWLERNGEEKHLPGLGYTPKQLFWISTATSFCDTIALDKLRGYIENEKVAYPNFRLFSALRNNENFGKDFNCPVNSSMNPEDKCKVF